MPKFTSIKLPVERMPKAIEIDNLVKNYGDIRAVNGISLEIEEGELFGLVGPDGAGKTTTIRTLCGLTSATSGTAKLFGMGAREQKREVQKVIGYLSQKFSLYGDLTVDENIEFFADIHNVKDFGNRSNELLEFTRLKPFRDRLADNLSGGMKQKLALACSLIHKPKILFLDEPTTGVDPVSRRDFWKILSELLKEGMTIFMTTPYLDEAERCTRVGLMNKGEIIGLDSPDKIKDSIDREVVEIVCSRIKKAYSILKEKHFEVQMFGDRVNAVIDDYDAEYPEIKRLLQENDIEIASSRVITPSLENVFIYLIKEAG